MVVWTRFRKYSPLVICAGAGLAVYYQHMGKSVVHASWTNSTNAINPCAIWDKNWDLRDPSSLVHPLRNDTPTEQNRYNCALEAVRPKVNHHIVLIRHGEYLDVGHKDEDHHLTERGREQAKYTGQRLRQFNIQWDSIIVSTMTRAKETWEIINKELQSNQKVTSCSLICEGAPIPPQPANGHWKPEMFFFRDGARIEAGFRRYFHRALPEDKSDRYTLVIGHANVIRYFVCRALQFPPEAWLRININHASINWLCISPSGNVSIKYLGDTGYIPVNMLTNRIPRVAKAEKC